MTKPIESPHETTDPIEMRHPTTNLLLRMLIRKHGPEPFEDLIETIEVKALSKEKHMEDCATVATAIMRDALRQRIKEASK